MRNKYQGRDLSDRLHGTIIRYKSQPYRALIDGGHIVLHSLPDGNVIKTVRSDDVDLDISSLPLGYMNYSKKLCAVYVQREPARRYKQGCDPDRLIYKPLIISKNTGFGSEVLYDKGAVESTIGIFPTFDQALRLITDVGYESTALSREVALLRDKDVLKVHYKGDEIGFISLKNGLKKKCTISKTPIDWVIKSLLEKHGIEAEGLLE